MYILSGYRMKLYKSTLILYFIEQHLLSPTIIILNQWVYINFIMSLDFIPWCGIFTTIVFIISPENWERCLPFMIYLELDFSLPSRCLIWDNVTNKCNSRQQQQRQQLKLRRQQWLVTYQVSYLDLNSMSQPLWQQTYARGKWKASELVYSSSLCSWGT